MNEKETALILTFNAFCIIAFIYMILNNMGWWSICPLLFIFTPKDD